MIVVTTVDGLAHTLHNLTPQAIAAYSTSPNTRQALQAAIAAGNYETLPDPEPVEQAPEPNPKGAYNVLIGSQVYQTVRAAAADSVACNLAYTDFGFALLVEPWNQPAFVAAYQNLLAQLQAQGTSLGADELAWIDDWLAEFALLPPS